MKIQKPIQIIKCVLTGALLLFIITACKPPSPFYGTWADNTGSKITFINDGTFLARIQSRLYGAANYEGNYNIIENVISFSINDGRQIVSEWDISGNLLKLDWPMSESGTLSLTLYKTSN